MAYKPRDWLKERIYIPEHNKPNDYNAFLAFYYSRTQHRPVDKYPHPSSLPAPGYFFLPGYSLSPQNPFSPNNPKNVEQNGPYENCSHFWDIFILLKK